ncbi:serine/arginine repetitive matrix protein 2 [Lingula anatina]|uniref:Serine/arginine repetitive matrix protein 2 n=1 Tax=Lingula anatina TaxID=7574 RepID=A0A2R2MJQ3_LINAN|nr:serine/arginine repetitive matrix protein 2 [Lingula anatina]|eukprot:XP_023930451.1 serine/arginine repetitive matrix protein 2 [Lingula anatina]
MATATKETRGLSPSKHPRLASPFYQDLMKKYSHVFEKQQSPDRIRSRPSSRGPQGETAGSRLLHSNGSVSDPLRSRPSSRGPQGDTAGSRLSHDNELIINSIGSSSSLNGSQGRARSESQQNSSSNSKSCPSRIAAAASISPKTSPLTKLSLIGDRTLAARPSSACSLPYKSTDDVAGHSSEYVGQVVPRPGSASIFEKNSFKSPEHSPHRSPLTDSTNKPILNSPEGPHDHSAISLKEKLRRNSQTLKELLDSPLKTRLRNLSKERPPSRKTDHGNSQNSQNCQINESENEISSEGRTSKLQNLKSRLISREEGLLTRNSEEPRGRPRQRHEYKTRLASPDSHDSAVEIDNGSVNSNPSLDISPCENPSTESSGKSGKLSSLSPGGANGLIKTDQLEDLLLKQALQNDLQKSIAGEETVVTQNKDSDADSGIAQAYQKPKLHLVRGDSVSSTEQESLLSPRHELSVLSPKMSPGVNISLAKSNFRNTQKTLTSQGGRCGPLKADHNIQLVVSSKHRDSAIAEEALSEKLKWYQQGARPKNSTGLSLEFSDQRHLQAADYGDDELDDSDPRLGISHDISLETGGDQQTSSVSSKASIPPSLNGLRHSFTGQQQASQGNFCGEISQELTLSGSNSLDSLLPASKRKRSRSADRPASRNRDSTFSYSYDSPKSNSVSETEVSPGDRGKDSVMSEKLHLFNGLPVHDGPPKPPQYPALASSVSGKSKSQSYLREPQPLNTSQGQFRKHHSAGDLYAKTNGHLTNGHEIDTYGWIDSQQRKLFDDLMSNPPVADDKLEENPSHLEHSFDEEVSYISSKGKKMKSILKRKKGSYSPSNEDDAESNISSQDVTTQNRPPSRARSEGGQRSREPNKNNRPSSRASGRHSVNFDMENSRVYIDEKPVGRDNKRDTPQFLSQAHDKARPGSAQAAPFGSQAQTTFSPSLPQNTTQAYHMSRSRTPKLKSANKTVTFHLSPEMAAQSGQSQEALGPSQPVGGLDIKYLRESSVDDGQEIKPQNSHFLSNGFSGEDHAEKLWLDHKDGGTNDSRLFSGSVPADSVHERPSSRADKQNPPQNKREGLSTGKDSRAPHYDTVEYTCPPHSENPTKSSSSAARVTPSGLSLSTEDDPYETVEVITDLSNTSAAAEENKMNSSFGLNSKGQVMSKPPRNRSRPNSADISKEHHPNPEAPPPQPETGDANVKQPNGTTSAIYAVVDKSAKLPRSRTPDNVRSRTPDPLPVSNPCIVVGGDDEIEELDTPTLPRRRYRSNLEESKELSGSRSSLMDRMEGLRRSAKSKFKAIKRAMSLDRIDKSRESTDSKEPGKVKVKRAPSLQSLRLSFSKKKEDRPSNQAVDIEVPVKDKKSKKRPSSAQTPKKSSQHLRRHSIASPEEVESPTHGRAIGRLLSVNSNGSQVIELIKPPHGPFGFYIARGNAKFKHGIFISRLSDGYPEKFFAGLLSVGDEILEVDTKPTKDLTLDDLYDFMATKKKLVLKTLPLLARTDT